MKFWSWGLFQKGAVAAPQNSSRVSGAVLGGCEKLMSKLS